MLQTLQRIEKTCDAIVDGVGRFAAWVLLLLVFLVFSNVVLRYLFEVGAVWAQELELYLLPVVAMLGIAYTMRRNEHVCVDILSQRFSATGRLWLNFLVSIFIIIPVSLLIIYYAYPFIMQAYTRLEGSPNPGGLPFRFIPKSFVAIGFVLVAIQGIAIAIRNGIDLFYKYY